MRYNIYPMDDRRSKEILKWKYPEPYSLYSLDINDNTINEFLSGDYYYATDNDEVIGYFCFGRSAQIPIPEAEGCYTGANYTDVGLGLRPDICGNGYGINFLNDGIEFVRECTKTSKIRLTVAEFNIRAIKVYMKIGFEQKCSFVRIADNMKFIIMELPN